MIKQWEENKPKLEDYFKTNKIDEFDRWVQMYMDKSKKVIIFSNHLNCQILLTEILKKHEYESVQLDGGNVEDIDKNIQKYKNR